MASDLLGRSTYREQILVGGAWEVMFYLFAKAKGSQAELKGPFEDRR